MSLSALFAGLGRGAVWKLGADVAGRLLQYVLLWLAAGSLAQGDFGDFSFALNMGYVLAQVADFGLQLFVQRELARLAIAGARERPLFSDERAAALLVGGGLVIKAVLSVAALLLMAALVLVEPVGNKGALLLVGLAMVLAGGLEYLAYCFRALRRLEEEALAIVFSRGTNLLLGAALLLMGGGVWGLAVAATLAMSGGTILAYRRLLRYLTPVWRADWGYWREHAGQPTAVGAGIIFSMLAFRADNLLIPPLAGREALGVYNVAYKLFEPVLVLPAVALAAIFPLMARAGGATKEARELRQVLGRTTLLLLGLGLLAGAMLAALAEPLLRLLYGERFAAAVPLLQLLALACLPMYLNYGLTHALIAMDRARTYAWAMLLALLANVAINLALIPVLGIAGAAMATVAAELFLLLICAGALLWPAGKRLAPLPAQDARLEGSL